MKRLQVIEVALAFVFALMAAQTAVAQSSAGRFVATSLLPGEARPIPAWQRFCEVQPRECQVDLEEPDVVKLSRTTWQRIIAVNARVNASVRPLTDESHWGTADVWSFPEDGYGDCEDYQLLKRKLLAEAGLPRRAMRMTVVIDELGEGHAVLMVRTDRGDFILDNKTSAVLPWDQTGYVFVKREGQNELGWIPLGGAASPTTTANR